MPTVSPSTVSVPVAAPAPSNAASHAGVSFTDVLNSLPATTAVTAPAPQPKTASAAPAPSKTAAATNTADSLSNADAATQQLRTLATVCSTELTTTAAVASDTTQLTDPSESAASSHTITAVTGDPTQLTNGIKVQTPSPLPNIAPATGTLVPNLDTASPQGQSPDNASDASDSADAQTATTPDSGDSNSDPSKLPVMVALPLTLLMPIQPPLTAPQTANHDGSSAPAATNGGTADSPSATATNVPLTNAAPQTGTPDQAQAHVDGAVGQLDDMRQILAAMTPVAPTALTPTDATPKAADAAAAQTPADPILNVRVTARTQTSNAQTVTNAPPAPDNVNAGVQPANPPISVPAPANVALPTATVQVGANAVAAKYGQQDTAHAQYSFVANSEQNAAQVPALPVDPHTVAAPLATAASAENNAGNADASADHERQQFQQPQLAGSAQTETFAANAFSAVAPGSYWTEKTSDAAPVKTSAVFQQVLDALPKPLQATTITIRPEGFGAIHIRVVPQPDNAQEPWRITIRTSDTSAHALLSQNVAELRQNLRSDPVSPFSTVRTAPQPGQESPAARQDGSDPKGGRRQDFEQRQRNRSRGFTFELPELDA